MTTSIGEMKEGGYVLHGIPLHTLITHHDWIAVMWFVWTGREITSSERVMFSACLVACVDHGEEPPSAQAACSAARAGASLAQSVAAGVSQFNIRHGHAASAACSWLRNAKDSARSLEALVEESLQRGERIPGFGHRVYEIDPRTQALTFLARQTLDQTLYLDLAHETARLLSEKKGRPLPLNIDGVVGAIVAELGLPSGQADAIFLVARTVGLVAHVQSVRTSQDMRPL